MTLRAQITLRSDDDDEGHGDTNEDKAGSADTARVAFDRFNYIHYIFGFIFHSKIKSIIIDNFIHYEYLTECECIKQQSLFY